MALGSGVGVDVDAELGPAAGAFEQAPTVATARLAAPARCSNRRRLRPGPSLDWFCREASTSVTICPYISLQLRNHLGGKPFHLLAVFADVRADRVQQDHLGARVDDLADTARDLVGCA